MDGFDKETHADIALAQRLRTERPELSPIQLDAIKGNVRRRVTGGVRAPAMLGRSFMKSRLALTMILVLGVMMSGTGATIAITGASGTGSAGVAQYDDGEDDNGEDDNGEDLAGQDQGAGGGGGGDIPQSTEQVAAQGGGDSLPFTGFVAIPLLIGGVALIGTGAVLRRRIRE
jgi:hypothetical protein